MTPKIGIVEGFDWRREDALDGHWGELRPEERVYLVSAMHTWGFDTFLYDPRALRRENADPAKRLQEPDHWPITFDAARDHQVDFVWGLAPGADGPAPGLFDGVERLLDLVASGVALLFDDLPGEADEGQVRAQGHLARNLEARFPGVVKAFRSRCAHAGAPLASVIPKLLDEELPESVALFWSSADKKAKTLEHVVFPDLERRSVWVWDDALTVDSTDPAAASLGPLAGRTPDILDGVGGWMLDAYFPFARSIAPMAVAGLLATGRVQPDDAIDALVNVWARWFHDVPRDAFRALVGVSAGTLESKELVPFRESLASKPGLRELVDHWCPAEH